MNSRPQLSCSASRSKQYIQISLFLLYFDSRLKLFGLIKKQEIFSSGLTWLSVCDFEHGNSMTESKD